MKRIPVRGIVVALLLVGLLVWIMQPQPVRVDVARVQRGSMQVAVREEGETRVRERFTVAAPVTGHLQRIRLSEGDPVEDGTIVARILPAPLDPRTLEGSRARLEAAEAMQRQARARLAQARVAAAQAARDRRRAKPLFDQGAISRQEWEQVDSEHATRVEEMEAAESALRAANAEVEQARAALLAAGDGQGDAPEGLVAVRSPVEGRVLRLLQESERIVSAGTPLLEVGDETDLEIVVDVLSSDAVHIRSGMRVWIHDWGGDAALPATVRLVEPSGFTKISALGVEEQRVNVIADFDTTPAPMGDGYRVEAEMVTWEADDVLMLPTSALFRSEQRWHVFRVRNGHAESRAIEIGHRNMTEAEVLEGVEKSDVVILHPSDRIDDGTPVEVGPE